MAKPALLVVYGDREMLWALEGDLGRRFRADYQIIAAATPEAGLDTLGRLRQAREQVALLLADQWLAGMTGVEFLCRAHELHPTAKRVLFMTYGDAAAGTAGLQAMALGQLDHYLNAPWGPPELQLYPTVGKALSQWARSTSSFGPRPELVRIVGPRWSPRSHELRDLMARNSITHGFYDADTDDGRRLLAQAGLEASGAPVMLLFDGQVLVDPPNDRLAQALGVQTQPTLDRYDVAVVGAGPAGLAAATYAASEGLHALPRQPPVPLPQMSSVGAAIRARSIASSNAKSRSSVLFQTRAGSLRLSATSRSKNGSGRVTRAAALWSSSTV
jgi:thioredoxin reductase (NADPH)